MTGTRVIALGLLALMFALLLRRLLVFLLLGGQALAWPWELHYGEGIVWQQANMMLTSQAYKPIGQLPAIVFHYPPLYHVITRILASLSGLDTLAAGRALSISSTLLMAIVAGLITACACAPQKPAWTGFLAGLASTFTVFCFHPVTFWSLLMRVDMLAFFLSLLGFWLGLQAFRRPAMVYAAAVCFVAAIFTKQTSLAAPAALFVLMLWLRPRLAFLLFASCVALGLSVLEVVWAVTDGGFFTHIFFYNINRFDWGRLWLVERFMVEEWAFVIVAIAMAYVRLRDILNRFKGQTRLALSQSWADVAFLGICLYFITSGLTLAAIAKSGSNMNYFIEWTLVLSILVGCGLAHAIKSVLDHDFSNQIGGAFLMRSVAIPLMVAFGALVSDGAEPNRYINFWSPQRGLEMQMLSERLRASAKPAISDDITMLLKSGKPVILEPAIIAELTAIGGWNEKPFVDSIKSGDFSMFITEAERGEPLFDSRYSPAVADAMDAAYPVKEKLAEHILHLPAATSSKR